MIGLLYKLPTVLLIILAAGTFGLAMGFIPRVVQRVSFMRPNTGNTDFVLRIQSTLFSMASLVIAFTLVEAQSNSRKVDARRSDFCKQHSRTDDLS